MTLTPSQRGSPQRGPSAARSLACGRRVALVLAFGCANEGHAAKAKASEVTARASTAGGVDAPGGSTIAEKAASQGCMSDADCVGGCNIWFEDADADGFGNADTARGFCGPVAPESAVPLVSNGHDCCDLNSRVNPTQTGSFPGSIQEDCPLAKGYDYDCDGVLRYGGDLGATSWAAACDDTSHPNNDPNTPCVERAGVFLGPGNALGLTPEDLLTADGDAALCGNPSVEWKYCAAADGACLGEVTLAPPCN